MNKKAQADQVTGQGGLFDHLFEPAADPNAALWGDRWLNKDRQEANVKPYGRHEPEPETFDPKVAAQLTEAAIERADQHADPDWKKVFFRTLIDVAATETEFTSDEVWERLQNDPTMPQTHERRAAGSIVRRAARAGLIDLPKGRTKPTKRAHMHKGLIQVYESRIHGKDARQFYDLATAGA